MDAFDYLGNLIKEGDQIVWPNRAGSSLWMNHGWVKTIGSVVTRLPVCFKVDNHGRTEKVMGELVHEPILIVDRYQGPFTKTKKVELRRLNRVVALGRHPHNFLPKKAANEFRETWLDRVMAWIRDRS